MSKITILIADDHTLVRQTWSFLLNADPRFKVVAECGSGEEAVKLAREEKPGIVIMDVSLPGINGIEATEKISKVSPSSKVLGISLHTQPTFAKKMIQMGAMGYLTKNSSKDEMMTALTEVAAGRKYICKEIGEILTGQLANSQTSRLGVEDLSGRELEIIALLKKGFNSREIAEELNLSLKTIEVHRYNILKKLNVKNTAALINFINNNQAGLV